MTALRSIQPIDVESLFPAYSESCEEETSWSLKQFKKPYSTLSCFFSWAEKLTDPSMSQFLSERRKVISNHSGMLDIPEWFEDGADLAKSVQKVKNAKNASEKRDAAAGLFFSSVGFTKASVNAMRAFDGAEVISLSHLSPALPSTLKGISSVAGLVVRTHGLYKQCMKTKKEYAKVPLKNVVQHLKQDKEAMWKALPVIRAVALFGIAILSVIGFFFAIKLSPFLMIAFPTLMCIASLMADLREAFSFNYAEMLSELG